MLRKVPSGPHLYYRSLINQAIYTYFRDCQLAKKQVADVDLAKVNLTELNLIQIQSLLAQPCCGPAEVTSWCSAARASAPAWLTPVPWKALLWSPSWVEQGFDSLTDSVHQQPSNMPKELPRGGVNSITPSSPASRYSYREPQSGMVFAVQNAGFFFF